MEMNNLKVVLEVLLKDLNKPSHNVKERSFKNLSDLKKLAIGNRIDIDKLESGVKKLINDFKEWDVEDCTKNIIFEYVLIVFSNTTQSQRFLGLHNILEHFYNKLVQKWLELGDIASIIRIEEYNKVVRKLIPSVKLAVLSDQLTSSSNNINEILQELYEVILYPSILREDCYEVIRNKLGTTDVDFVDFKVKPVNEKFGFLGDYYRLEINIKENGLQRTQHLFAKFLPSVTDETRKVLSSTAFKKEKIFYAEFVPILRSLELDDVLDFLPNCYYSGENFMIYDDISIENYSNLDIHTTLGYEQLSSMLKQLAKLNSTGILFEEKLSNIIGKPIYLNDYFKDMVVENFVDREKGFGEMFKCALRTFYHILNKIPEFYENENLDNFKKQIANSYNSYYEKVKPSQINRNFLCHGDFWINNVLFKKNCAECFLLDYQLLRYSSPTFDVLLVLYLHTDKKTRDTSGTRLLNEYYHNLKDNLEKYNVDIDQIYPYETYQKSLEEVKPVMMELALTYMQFILLPKETKYLFEDPVFSQRFLTEDRTDIIDKNWEVMEVSKFKDVFEELYTLLNKK